MILRWLKPDAHKLVERHFAGRLPARSHRRLWRHLEGCARCRHRYKVYAQLEELEPDAEQRALARLAPAGLAIAAATKSRWGNAWLLGVGAAVATGLLLVLMPQPRKPASDFGARGGPGTPEAMPSVSVFRVSSPRQAHEKPAPHARVDDHVLIGEGLAFSYLLPDETPYSRLMIFAVDVAGHVFWFWPAWQHSFEDPQGLPVEASARPQELGEAIFHDYRPGPLHLYALFSQRPHSVKEVEAIVMRAGAKALVSPGNHLWTQPIEVRP